VGVLDFRFNLTLIRPKPCGGCAGMTITGNDFATEILGQHTSKVAEKLCLQAAQKDSEARRAKNRRVEAYSGGTLERVD
jgi:hypothetical protein